MTQPARVAVIGAAGWAGSRHVAAFHSLDTQIVALIDPGSGVHELAHKVDADVVDLPDRLTAGDVDLVVVALPSSAQPEVTADLLRRDLRVLVEKPIGSSADNAAPLAQVDDIDENLMVGYTLHHHPAAKALTAWVTSSTVISISVRSAARKLQLDSWRIAPQEGGVAVINGIHAIEYVASMFPGTVTVDSVYASDQLHRTSAPDYVSASLLFEDGPLLRLETYWNRWEHTAGLNRSDWSLEIDVIAHEGRRTWSNWALHSWDGVGAESVQHFPETDLFLMQARAALDFARGGPPTVGYRQAIRATEIADEIIRRGRDRA